MGKACSDDLRERVVKNYSDGMQQQDIIRNFSIGMDTLNRWIRKYRKQAS
jgi:transposase